MTCRARPGSRGCGASAMPSSNTAMAAPRPAPKLQNSSPTLSSRSGACRWPAERFTMTLSAQAETGSGVTQAAQTCLLEFRNIRIVYDNAIEAIRDVSITVPESGIVALLGSNGAGKSTLLKAMSGILYTEEGAIENGAIRFRNDEVHRLPPDELVRRGIV